VSDAHAAAGIRRPGAAPVPQHPDLSPRDFCLPGLRSAPGFLVLEPVGKGQRARCGNGAENGNREHDFYKGEAPRYPRKAEKKECPASFHDTGRIVGNATRASTTMVLRRRRVGGSDVWSGFAFVHPARWSCRYQPTVVCSSITRTFT
jgi:hypothetical protein